MSFSFECLFKLKLHFIVFLFCCFYFFFAVVQHMDEIFNIFPFLLRGFLMLLYQPNIKKSSNVVWYLFFLFLSFSWNQYFFADGIICSSLTNTLKVFLFLFFLVFSCFFFAYDNSIWKFHSLFFFSLVVGGVLIVELVMEDFGVRD